MASCVCSLRRLLNPSSTSFVSVTSIVARWEHAASSQDASSTDVAKGLPSGGSVVGPEYKRADGLKDSRTTYVWAPDPETGHYRPVKPATDEAQEKSLKRKK